MGDNDGRLAGHARRRAPARVLTHHENARERAKCKAGLDDRNPFHNRLSSPRSCTSYLSCWKDRSWQTTFGDDRWLTPSLTKCAASQWELTLLLTCLPLPYPSPTVVLASKMTSCGTGSVLSQARADVIDDMNMNRGLAALFNASARSRAIR